MPSSCMALSTASTSERTWRSLLPWTSTKTSVSGIRSETSRATISCPLASAAARDAASANSCERASAGTALLNARDSHLIVVGDPRHIGRFLHGRRPERAVVAEGVGGKQPDQPAENDSHKSQDEDLDGEEGRVVRGGFTGLLLRCGRRGR